MVFGTLMTQIQVLQILVMLIGQAMQMTERVPHESVFILETTLFHGIVRNIIQTPCQL